MLDAATKARIDSARDILVGKVPDPKSQVEQITIALIYKFMDDMDRQSVELGGKSSFFEGEFKKYRWADLLDNRFGGHERLLRYAEGIERMNENKNIPQLFRDIFKGVFLPYRDPETLNLFLKEINGFTYDHSERLGDAYEYLLNVLGTQGDAGQFRTPRHIIDFIATVVDPQKHETVLDPACGTAGFLISAYKHIMAACCPDRSTSQTRPTTPLTPDERAQLMKNFCGYDIAPDMVRLSRVNLYLHGFPNPVLHEYDTLTSEERWDERYDVIMANPPFMTPKGGIRPHNRFSIKANRSEVLFVDYIAEHLNPGGRAGIIVPEGIIFQSQNAYRALRKMLVENYLWAVVSLPAGVFNPYSGVKTSILFLDRNLTKQSGSVLFVKIANDGFDLGAQRRPIAANDLPEVLKTLLAWKQNQKTPKEGIAHAVLRKRLLESPDVSLSGDRYRQVAIHTSKWPQVPLADFCKIIQGGRHKLSGKHFVQNGGFPAYGAGGLNGYLPNFEFEEPAVVLSSIGARCGKCFLAEGKWSSLANTQLIFPDPKRVLVRFLWYQLNDENKWPRAGAGQPFIKPSDVRSHLVALPPLAEQERLVAELEGYRKLIEAARLILANYKPSLPIQPDWPMLPVGDVVDFVSGLTLSIPECEDPAGVPILSINNISEDGEILMQAVRTIKVPRGKKAHFLQKGDLLFNWRNGSSRLVGKTGLWNREGLYAFASFLLGVRPRPDCIDPRYLWALLNAYRKEGRYMQMMRRNVNGLFNREELRLVSIPVPPLAEQRAIVAELEAERSLVEANRELIARMEKKMQAKLAEIWGA